MTAIVSYDKLFFACTHLASVPSAAHDVLERILKGRQAVNRAIQGAAMQCLVEVRQICIDSGCAGM